MRWRPSRPLAVRTLARRGSRVVYVSGEEAVDQVRLRAARLGLASAPVELAAETSVADIVATLGAGRAQPLAGGLGGGAGGNSREAMRARMAAPEMQNGNPKFNRAAYDQLMADYQKLIPE